MATASKGRQQAKSSRKAKTRSDVPVDYWKRPGAPLVLARDEFRVRVKRGDKQDILMLDAEVTDIAWDDTGGPVTGSVTFSKGFRPSPVEEGHLFLLEWRSGATGIWKEVWRMRAKEPESQINAGTQSLLLVSDLEFLRASKDDFKYGKNKKHPNGVKVSQIVRLIALRYKMPVGKLAAANYRVKKFTASASSPYDAILKALKLERNEGSGKRLILRSRRGRLEVVPLHRSRNMLLIGPAIIDATVKKSLKKGYASSLSVKGTLRPKKKGAKRKKANIRVLSPAAVRRFGYIHDEITAPKGADTTKELRTAGKRELAKRFKPQVEVNFSHPGVPSLKRWDAMKVYIPEENVNVVCFVSEVRHSVSSGSYNMDVVCRFTDPFVDKKLLEQQAKKCKAAKKRKRKAPSFCKKFKQDRPKPKKAKGRKDK